MHLLASLLALTLLAAGAQAEGRPADALTAAPITPTDLRWEPVSGPLPFKPGGAAFQSRPLAVGNPLLKKVCEKLYAVPWAPGEAVLLQPRPGVTAFGFWNGTKEFQILLRQGARWWQITPAGATEVAEARLAYFGHEATGQAVAWSGPARVLVAGPGAPQGLEVTRVPLFEAGCALMVLERSERELRQGREFLRWMQPPAPDVARALDDCQARIDGARMQLRRQTHGLLETYQALPEPRYALENLAFFSRLYGRTKGFEKIGDPDLWARAFYGRPEFASCVEARKAAQEALWAQRPATLPAETARVYGRDARFAASITHGLTKFRRDKPFPQPLRTGHRLVLARDEYEPFQVVIAALDQPVRDGRVSVQWEGAGPHPEVVFRPVGYVQTKPDPDNLAEYVGWWPDPLLPPGPAQAAAWETQPVWGSVHATRATRPGDHVGTVTVQAQGAPPLKMRVTARVLEFNLGFTHLPSLLSLRLDSIKQFYKLGAVSQEVKRRWYAFCLQYRMNPNNIYGEEFIPEEEDLDFCIQRGFNAMVMTTPPLRRTTRNAAGNLQVWASDDNRAFRQIPVGFSVAHDENGGLGIGGLDVTARYLKVHSTLADDAYEFSLKTLERDRIVAYDGGQAHTGPAAYVGTAAGTTPLLSFGATWGAALDYRRSSLGVDLGEPRHVSKLMLQGGSFGRTRERVRRFYQVAKAHGLGDRAYVYGFDEWADVDRYGVIKSTYDELKAVAPGIKACSTVVHPVPPIERAIDAWCPALCYDYAGYRQARRRGQEVWYYEGGCPYDPYPTHELLDVPAVEARAFFWVAWRYQYTGWLHWELNCWLNNMSGDKRWPEVPWDPARSGVRNGEVGRIYPGPDATPLPSVRLENMRDGIEDYDYLWLLRERARKLPAGSRQRRAVEQMIDGSTRALCQSRAHFERDPEKVLAVHEKMGLLLERLARGVPVK